MWLCGYRYELNSSRHRGKRYGVFRRFAGNELMEDVPQHVWWRSGKGKLPVIGLQKEEPCLCIANGMTADRDALTVSYFCRLKDGDEHRMNRVKPVEGLVKEKKACACERRP